MGTLDVREARDEVALRRFTRALLDDVQALEDMERAGAFTEPAIHIGAEQELFLVDRAGRPAPVAEAVLRTLDDPTFTTELARFNLEFNLPPLVFRDRCLRDLSGHLESGLARIRTAAAQSGADAVLVGILPSITIHDLTDDNIVPLERYLALNRLLQELTGGKFHTQIQGRDELQLVHDNVLLEGCNTSFQVHLEVTPAEFPKRYNLAQVISAPVLAAAGNSPLLLQRRLWDETRIALFEQSFDIRPAPHRVRDAWQRVSFGDDWVHRSVVELHRDSIARHHVLLVSETGEPATEIVRRGEVPPLSALSLHNGTVYRWNRACYGVTDGRPHLRIEHRPLPAGPTVVDEVANAAFFFGLMHGLNREWTDVREHFVFDDVKANFVAAARYGLNASIAWADGRRVPAAELIRSSLLPIARRGLSDAGIHDDDADFYLGVIDERVAGGQTGAVWLRRAFERITSSRPGVRGQVVVRALQARQWRGEPVATWDLPDEDNREVEFAHYQRVDQVMATRLFTLSPDDLVDVAASVMRWQHLRHLPVETREGELVGLVSYRSLLRVVAEGLNRDSAAVPVRDIMQRDPVTVAPEARALDAIRLMRQHEIACVPVVKEGKLVGMLSERDFLNPAVRWFEARLSEDSPDE